MVSLPDRVGQIRGGFALAQQRRFAHEEALRDILWLMLPYRGPIDARSGDSTMWHEAVTDSTAMQGMNRLANFLKAQLFPASSNWLSFAHPEHAGRVTIRVRQLYVDAALRVQRTLSGTNFYIANTHGIRDLAAIGNAVILPQRITRRDGSPGYTFTPVHILRCWWETNLADEIARIFVGYEMPALWAYQFFDGAPGPGALEAIRAGDSYRMLKYLHVVHVNEKDIPGGLPAVTNLPFVSLWLEMNAETAILRERGFKNFPYVVARASVPDGEVYGTGLGHIARPDALGVNEGRRQILISIQRDLNPRLMVENESVVQVQAGPSGTMVIRRPHRLVPQYLHSESNYAAAEAVFNRDRAQILATFLADSLGEPESQPRSAEETIERRRRALEQLAVVGEIADHQTLAPQIQWVVSDMMEHGELPELEQVVRLTGIDQLEVTFTSPFFTALKSQEFQKLRAFVFDSVALAKAKEDPGILDWIDSDQYMQDAASFSDVNPGLFRTPAQVAERRRARAGRNAIDRLAELGGIQRGAPAPAEAPVG